MGLLFIENDDSFSWNIIDRLPFGRADVEIVPGRESHAVLSSLPHAHAVVLGPGPLDPIRAGIVALVPRIAELNLPLLGICLGHQAIGLAWGARLIQTSPRHGVREHVDFKPNRFFPAFTGATEVMRYHSLSLTDVPLPLQVTARTVDGTVMAIEHRELPMAGLQFHPDSFATPRGEEMLASFFENARP